MNYYLKSFHSLINNCIHFSESFIVQMRQEKKFYLSTNPEYLLQEKSDYREQVTVSQVFIHPEYSKAPLQNDLAILLLDPVELQ